MCPMRKVLSVLLSCIMLISMIGVLPARQVSAESGSGYDDEIKIAFNDYGEVAVLTRNNDLYCWGGYTDRQTRPVKIMGGVSQFSLNGDENAVIQGNDLYWWSTSPNRGILSREVIDKVKASLSEEEKLSDIIDNTVPHKIMSNVSQVIRGGIAVVDDYGSLYVPSDTRYYEDKEEEKKRYEEDEENEDGEEKEDYRYCRPTVNEDGSITYNYSSGEYWRVLDPPLDFELNDISYLVYDNNHSTARGGFAAITNGGGLYCWGSLYGSTDDSFGGLHEVPPQLMLNNVSQVIPGGICRGAITNNGDLYTWGSNQYGCLGVGMGDGLLSTQETPTKILSNVKQASLGEHAGAAVTEDGELYSWGFTGYYTGLETQYFEYAPIGGGGVAAPTKIMDNVKQVSMGKFGGAAVTEDGDLYTWGYNGRGLVGNGTTVDQRTPVKIMSNVIQVTVSNRDAVAFAVTEDGYLYGWGRNDYGQVGNGSTADQLKPVRILNLNGRDDEEEIDGDCGLSIQQNMSVCTGETVKLLPAIYAENQEDMIKLSTGITFSSSDPSVATVSGTLTMFQDTAPKTYSAAGVEYSLWWAHGIAIVSGHKTGTAIITVTLANGLSESCEITVTDQQTDTSGAGSTGYSFVMGENQQGSADSSSGVGKFFPDNWTMKSSAFPVEVSKSVEEDGTYTIKASIGIGRSDILDEDNEWVTYKTACEDAEKALNGYAQAELLRQKFGGKSSTAINSSGWSGSKKPELSIVGYVKNYYGKYGDLIKTEGAIAGDLEWSGDVSWNFATPIGPMYLKLGASGGISLSGGPVWDNEKKSMGMDGSVTLTPGISVTGGYGIDKVASISATGEASMEFQVLPWSKGTLEAAASVNAHVIFVFDQTWELKKYENILWDTTVKTDKSFTTSDLSEENMKLMNAPGEEDVSEWSGDVTGDAGTHILKEGLLGSSIPMLVQYGDKQVLVWQEYDGTRQTANSSVLTYSVYNNGEWSKPTAVYDDGCGDSYADIKVINDTLALVWQKQTKTITDEEAENSETALSTLAANSEIYYAEFDNSTDTFTNIIRITDNEYCDMMPKFVEGTNDISVAYVRNDDNSFLQTSGNNQIYCSKYDDGSFSEETLVETAQGTIDRYVPYMQGEAFRVMYVTQVEDMVVLANNFGEQIDAFNELMCFAEDGTISKLEYEDGMIHVMCNGELYVYNPDNGKVTQYSAGNAAFDSTAAYCSNGNKSAYVWSVYNDEDGIGSVVASMKTDSGYSDPVTLYTFDKEVSRVIAPVLTDDGTWNIAVNQENFATSSHNLMYLQKEESKASQLYTAHINENDTKNGLTAVDYIYANTSDSAIDNVSIVVEAENGQKAEKTENLHLDPGQVVSGTIYIDLTAIDAGQNVSISIYEPTQAENTVKPITEELAVTDISLVGTATEDENGIQISAIATNEGSKDAQTVITLYEDAEMTTKLSTADSVNVEAGKTETVNFTVNPDDVVYNEDGAAYLTLYSEVEGGDINDDNNITYLALYQGEKVYADTHVKVNDEDEDDSGLVDPPDDSSEQPITPVNPGDDDSSEQPPTPVNPGDDDSSKQQTPTPQGGGNTTTPPIPAPQGDDNLTTQQTTSSDNTTTTQQKDSTGGNTIANVAIGQNLTDTKAKVTVKVISNTLDNPTAAYVRSTDKNAGKKTSLSVPDTVTIEGVKYKIVEVSASAFKNKKKLKKVTIGKNVTTIGDNAFAGCSKLKKIIIKSTVLKSVGKNAIKGINKKASIKVPKKQLKAYKKLFTKKTGYKKTMKVKK